LNPLSAMLARRPALRFKPAIGGWRQQKNRLSILQSMLP
jgi:hypothetical protein